MLILVVIESERARERESECDAELPISMILKGKNVLKLKRSGSSQKRQY